MAKKVPNVPGNVKNGTKTKFSKLILKKQPNLILKKILLMTLKEIKNF